MFQTTLIHEKMLFCRIRPVKMNPVQINYTAESVEVSVEDPEDFAEFWEEL